MKKILSLVVCLVLMLSFAVTASAANATATLSGVPAEIKKDATATVNVSLNGTPTLSSALIQITLGDGLELVSGEWKKDGFMKDFTLSNGYGVIAFTSAGTMDGTVFSFVVKGKTISSAAQNVKVEFTFKNGSSDVGTATASKTVKVACVTHTYGAYTKKDNSNHTRTCSACGSIETKAHSWNAGTITEAANCKKAGTRTYTCTASGCGATKTEPIAKTNNHTYGNWSQISAPKCTTVGKEQRTCSTCQKVETRDIEATGHSLGSWKTTKEAKCETKGEQTRSCSKCSYKETKAIDALDHKFSSPTVTKQPTCTEEGIESGKCSRCNKETTNAIKATGHKMGESIVTLEPTCTVEGKKEGTCSVCGQKAEEKVAAKGHAFCEAVVTKEATETETGLKTKTCTACGETEEEVIPVLGTVESEVESDAENTDDKSQDSGSSIKWIFIGLGSAIAVAVIVLIIVIKKK